MTYEQSERAAASRRMAQMRLERVPMQEIPRRRNTTRTQRRSAKEIADIARVMTELGANQQEAELMAYADRLAREQTARGAGELASDEEFEDQGMPDVPPSYAESIARSRGRSPGDDGGDDAPPQQRLRVA